MRSRLTVLLVVLTGAAGLARAEDAAEDERQKLIGTWTGNCGPLKITLTITAEEISAVQDGKKDLGAGTYAIDPEKKHLDATRTRGPDARGTHLGLYKLEGDVLQWCVNRPRQGRPKEFRQGPRDGGGWLVVLNRVKAPEK